MYRRISSSRYATYEHTSTNDESSWRHTPPVSATVALTMNGHISGSSTNGILFGDRLKKISSSMSWIRDELEELKESDRDLMDIFKQLEGDVAELTDNISTWRLSGYYGRPASTYSELDYSPSPITLSSSYIQDHNSSLESTLTSSKEEVSTKTSNGSDSALAPDADLTTTNSYSPGCTPLASGASPGYSKRRQTSASPQLKGSMSLNKIVSSPSISSSIDSGIQFASEAENGSGNSMEPTASSVTETTPPHVTLTTPNATPSLDDSSDTSFASDIFKTLGLNL